MTSCMQLSCASRRHLSLVSLCIRDVTCEKGHQYTMMLQVTKLKKRIAYRPCGATDHGCIGDNENHWSCSSL